MATRSSSSPPRTGRVKVNTFTSPKVRAALARSPGPKANTFTPKDRAALPKITKVQTAPSVRAKIAANALKVKVKSSGPYLADDPFVGVKPISFKQLYTNALRTDAKNAGDVRVFALKRGKVHGWPGYLTKSVTLDGGKPRTYNHHVVARDMTASVSQSKAVHVSCQCLGENTRVLTDEGYKTMLEIAGPVADEYPIKYKVGRCTYNGSRPFFTGVKKTWRITLSNGNSILSTAEHLFRRIDAIKFNPVFGKVKGKRKYLRTERTVDRSWVKAGKLSVGDKLAVPNIPAYTIGNQKTFDEGFFLGLIMGDGTVSMEGYTNLGLTLQDRKRVLVKYLDDMDIIKSINSQTDPEWNNRPFDRISFNNYAYEILARHKFVNKESVDIRNIDTLMGYLSGLLCTDGSVGDGHILTICGSESCLRQLKAYMEDYGYPVKLRLSRAAGYKTNWSVSTKDMYMLSLNRPIIEKIDGLRLLAHHSDKLYSHERSYQQRKVQYTTILDITYAGKKRVYDITVPDAEHFVAEGVIVHNCPRHMYYYEFSLNKRGGADIIFSNGEPPLNTNPALYAGACKHVLRVLEKISSQESR